MRVDLAQVPVVRSVTPTLAATYLHSKGWSRVLTDRGRYSIWSKPGCPEVLLPLESAIPDYMDRLLDLLQDLQQIEARPLSEIAKDIASGNCDVFRFKKHPDTAIEGTIAIEAGAALVAKVRDILLLSAVAEYDPEKRTLGGRLAATFERQAIRREALLEAAKLVCWQCGRGKSELRDVGDGEYEHVYSTPPAECVPCQASEIHAAIAAEEGGK